ncbi:hypothetical protein [Flavihumibacter solisilvae]|uniref:DUF885 domain-containing protein n=1 Tax=Flavihumibacter solisilvae TaxID=1349421 RepID=A0A0C1IL32_9BACT|nr:hypothetical protein [Flavihumibacter solisilvae]KIC94865.1 hypothetical protein OI18_08070 [Flavihumibacter solisilvae]
MNKFFILASIFLLSACGQSKTDSKPNTKLDDLAHQYVKLGLTIGQYDTDFVDAYYGPDSLKPTSTPKGEFPKDSLLTAVSNLVNELNTIDSTTGDTLAMRIGWIKSQLRAFDRRIRIFAGEQTSFDQETQDLFGVTVPKKSEAHFKELVSKLDSMLPGKGDINQKFQQLANHFIIPKNRLDTVFKAAIAECRKRTKQHYTLPENESFTLEYVNNKPWSGYNWYKGNYRSVIQINTDMQIFIDRSIDVGSHESYPGHHVYNMLLEKNLYRDKGWVEISLYPLFSPQSLIAEGSANYGIAVAFPGDDKVKFAKEVLLPLAGLDTAGISTYFNAMSVRDELNYARNEVARGLLDGSMTEEAAIKWLMDYSLMNKETAAKSISFIRRNRSYVINYNYGKDLVRNYIMSKGGEQSPGKQWELFGWLLSNPVRPADLQLNAQ